MPMAVSAFKMPQTVPNSPTNGAVEPTEARKEMPPQSAHFPRRRHDSDDILHPIGLRKHAALARHGLLAAFRDTLRKTLFLAELVDAVLEVGSSPELLLRDLGLAMSTRLVPNIW